MLASRYYAKIFATQCDLAIRDFIPIFHRWIREKRGDELLIDVHDYSHVHDGPGVILVGHTCMYALDRTDGQLGLSYKRRRGEPLSIQTGLQHALAHAARGAEMLTEDSQGGIRFGCEDVVVGVEDRLQATNSGDEFAKYLDDFSAVAAAVYRAEPKVSHLGDARAPLQARLSGTPVPELAAVLR